METIIGHSIEKAREYLENGELVAIPTETVYGLAGNALNEDAVLAIFKAKNRPEFNPLIIHLPFWQDVKKYVERVPSEATELAMFFSPGPITYLLRKKAIIPDLVTAGSKKVAVRIPAHTLTLQLLRNLHFPIAAPSANLFGYVSPTTAAHVYAGLNGRIPYILDGGECTIGLESTIVDFEDGEVIIRRNGGISKEAIEEVLKKPVRLETEVTNHPVAPGQLKSHYATHTPLRMVDLDDEKIGEANKSFILIGFGSAEYSEGYNLSPEGDLEEAAKNLFSMLRKADEAGVDEILAEWLPDEGLGRAINDRLERAQHSQKLSSF